MKIKYLTKQIKQFALTTGFVLLGLTGISISKSFDQTYMAQVNAQKTMEKKIIASEKLEVKSKKTKTGVASLE